MILRDGGPQLEKAAQTVAAVRGSTGRENIWLVARREDYPVGPDDGLPMDQDGAGNDYL